MIGHWAVQIGAVVYHTMGPVVSLDTCVFVGQEVDHLLILIKVGVEGLNVSKSVIICNILFGGTSDSIVMLINSH